MTIDQCKAIEIPSYAMHVQERYAKIRWRYLYQFNVSLKCYNFIQVRYLSAADMWAIELPLLALSSSFVINPQ